MSTWQTKTIRLPLLLSHTTRGVLLLCTAHSSGSNNTLSIALLFCREDAPNTLLRNIADYNRLHDAWLLLTRMSRVPISTLRPALLKGFTWSSSVLACTSLQMTPPVYSHPNTEPTDSVIKQTTNTYRPTRRHAHFVTCPERLCRDWATMTSQVLRCDVMVSVLLVAV